jgi:phage-related protein
MGYNTTQDDSRQWSVEFYADAMGRIKVLEFINGLPAQERSAIKRCIELLLEFGIQLPAPHIRAIVGHRKLWELRAGSIRLLHFAHTGRRFVILHAFRKKGQKTPQREIAVAERRKAEFLERVGDE